MPKFVPALLLASTLVLAGSGSSQKGKADLPVMQNQTSSPLGVQDVSPFPDLNGQPDTPLAQLAREARMRNEERQKHLAQDTARLVELSTQLQAEVNRNNKNVLSLESIRRTEEIEKLARKVRDRLKS